MDSSRSAQRAKRTSLRTDLSPWREAYRPSSILVPHAEHIQARASSWLLHLKRLSHPGPRSRAAHSAASTRSQLPSSQPHLLSDELRRMLSQVSTIARQDSVAGRGGRAQEAAPRDHLLRCFFPLSIRSRSLASATTLHAPLRSARRAFTTS